MDHTSRFHWLLTTQPPYDDSPGDHAGDSFEWMHARQVLWPLSHSPSTTIAFSPNHDPMLRHGVWQAVIDLLVYGNGWLDLAGELRAWRKSDYRITNDVLNFIFHNFRELLLPLETYFAVRHSANKQIAEYLRFDLEHREIELLTKPRPIGNIDALIRKCQKLDLDRSSYVYDIVQALPQSASGDHSGDPLHISSHFTFEWTQAELDLGKNDKVSKVADDLGTVTFAHYGHWYRKAHALTDKWLIELKANSASGDVLDYGVSIDVHILGIGFLGRFARIGRHGRLCRVAPTDTSHTVEREISRTDTTKIEVAPKIRYSDVPPALQKLMIDMINKVEAKIGQDADDHTERLKTFMSSNDYYNQSEISSEMAKLLRHLA